MYREADGTTALPFVTDRCTVEYELDDGTVGAVVIRPAFQPGAATPGSPWGSALIGKPRGAPFEVKIMTRPWRILNGTITDITH